MGNSKIHQLKTIAHELKQLHIKTKNHVEERTSSDGHIYANTYGGWLNEYNPIVRKYNNLTSADLSERSVSDYELSSTRKTVRLDSAISFSESVEELSNKIEDDIRAEQNKDEPIPLHQMRVCFKTGAKGCPLNPAEKKNKVFVAMPFSDDYKDSYEYGVKLVLDRMGIEHYKADNEVNNKDTMCKICKEIQSCGIVIANISSLNPNVMLELGLAYGLGKKVVIIKDKKTTTVSDLGGIEYIEYSHAGELQQKLPNVF